MDMASVSVPQSALRAVRDLVDLSDSDFVNLVLVLEETAAGLSPQEFISKATSKLAEINVASLEMIISELVSMRSAAAASGLSLNRFAAEASDSVLEGASSRFPFSSEERYRLEARLMRAFDAKGLSITAKARSILFDTDKTFLSARVLTDVRPIFDEEAKSVSGAVVIHNLRIRYYDNGDQRDIYISLEGSDVESLLEVLRRALKKGEVLKNPAGITHFSILD